MGPIRMHPAGRGRAFNPECPPGLARGSSRFHRSVVYLARRVDTGLIKIGTTRTVVRRMREIELSIRQTVHLLGVIPGGIHLEHALHRAFAEERREGEWFAESPRMLPVIRYELQHPARVLPEIADLFLEAKTGS